jgi:hypothetical protein
MRKLLIIIVLPIIFSSVSFSQNYYGNYKSGPNFFGGIVVGYNGGFGSQINATISHFQNRFPLSIRIGLGITTLDPGNSATARRIFINNATNGTPEESGLIWDLRLDLLFPVTFINNSFVYFGPRYSMFTGNFKFVGGNEDFDVTSDQFGLGGGIETHFPVISNLSIIFSGGAEYYFNSTLKGHDTSYSPDGDDVNPREDYSYTDADDAINQPKILARIMLGINYAF